MPSINNRWGLLAGVPAAAGGPQRGVQPAAAGGAGMLPHYTEEDVCIIVNYLNQEREVGWITTTTYGWRQPGRVFIYSSSANPELNILTLPELAGTAQEERGMLLVRAVSGRADTAHCAWFYLTDEDDFVNPRGLAHLTYGLHADTPLAISFFGNAGATGGVTAPLHNHVLYSRAAVDAIAARAYTADCPGADANGQNAPIALARCGWIVGVVSVHTFVMDALGFGPGRDWALQNPHYLMGWASAWHDGIYTTLLERYYNGLYAGAWNLTCTEQACSHPIIRRRDDAVARGGQGLRGEGRDDAEAVEARLRAQRTAMAVIPAAYLPPSERAS